MNAAFLRKQTRVALLTLLWLATGCYRYTPLPGAPAPEAEVRLRLTQAGSASLAPVLGRGTVAVEGRVAAVTDTAYVLAVSATLKPSETSNVSDARTVWAGEMVNIPRASVASADNRTLDRGHTATVFGVSAVAAAILVKLVVHTLGSGGSGGDAGGTIVTP